MDNKYSLTNVLLGETKKKTAKKLTASDLRTLILNESKRVIKEHTIPDKDADINDMDASAVWGIMTGDDVEAAQSLIDRIGSATGWGGGALKKAGVTGETLKDKAEEIFGDESTFAGRVSGMVTKLNAAEGFSKPEMPALEGGDVAAVTDALSEPGEYNIDIGSDYGGGTNDFQEYAAEELDKVVKDEAEAAGDTNESIRGDGNLLLERWGKIVGLTPITEIEGDKRFPFPGAASVMPGAPNLGADGAADLDAVSGEAELFLKKGKGNEGDDLGVAPNQPMKNSEMKPTQKNVKAAKSMLFALANIGQDMEGAFASSDGEIIDGHHRWSGQWLRTGGEATMAGVHVIEKGGMSTPEFLTMLTVLGNAIGRPTKVN